MECGILEWVEQNLISLPICICDVTKYADIIILHIIMRGCGEEEK
jgi:hypothetical protein